MVIQTFILSLALNLVGFLLGYSFRSDKFTDISYSLTFTVLAIFGFFQSEMQPAQWLVTVIILLWAYRIGNYLFKRIKVIGHDKRFDDRRDDFVKFGSFWLLQAVTAWLVMMPATLLYGIEDKATLTTAVIIGAVISVLGVIFEAVADRQKFKFITEKSNKGKWIQSGLWKYSRHPNYFGEILMWVGVYVMSIQWLDKNSIYLATIGPVTIIFMLLFVSGVPLLEKSADKKWGKNKNYIKYRDTTSILIPMPPKKG